MTKNSMADPQQIDAVPKPPTSHIVVDAVAFVPLYMLMGSAVALHALLALADRGVSRLTVAGPASIAQLQRTYHTTAAWYDVWDAPYERLAYAAWRPLICGGVTGDVLDAGVGTGRNLPYYPAGANVTGIDLSRGMLACATRRAAASATCNVVSLQEGDASRLVDVNDGAFDYYIATFLLCVLPNDVQQPAVSEVARVLRPGGKFKILAMRLSDTWRAWVKQQLMAPLVFRLYGANFSRPTLAAIRAEPRLKITKMTYLAEDVDLLVEGERV
jgi:ubiquinone/menaquinone biosynthesis C-methylase UbiE